jgi:hypothetical protein
VGRTRTRLVASLRIRDLSFQRGAWAAVSAPGGVAAWGGSQSISIHHFRGTIINHLIACESRLCWGGGRGWGGGVGG